MIDIVPPTFRQLSAPSAEFPPKTSCVGSESERFSTGVEYGKGGRRKLKGVKSGDTKAYAGVEAVLELGITCPTASEQPRTVRYFGGREMDVGGSRMILCGAFCMMLAEQGGTKKK